MYYSFLFYRCLLRGVWHGGGDYKIWLHPCNHNVKQGSFHFHIDLSFQRYKWKSYGFCTSNVHIFYPMIKITQILDAFHDLHAGRKMPLHFSQDVDHTKSLHGFFGLSFVHGFDESINPLPYVHTLKLSDYFVENM